MCGTIWGVDTPPLLPGHTYGLRFMSPSYALIHRRFLIFRALRWLPTGLLVPVLVLLMLHRGLSIGEVGIATAANGIVVLILELPTGGLADAIGRRPVLVAATVIDLAAVSLLFFADSLVIFALVFALQGIYRALDSGPLEAWYVDTALELDPSADIESGLSAGGAAAGTTAAAGALLSAGIVAAAPFPTIDPLAAPLLIAIAVRAAEAAALAVLMVENPGVRRTGGAAVGQVPTIVMQSVSRVRRSPVLLSLLSVQFFWGAGVAAVEVLTPPKIADSVGATDSAAVLFGVATAGVWLTSALGSALIPRVTRVVSVCKAAAMLRLLEGAAVVAVGLIGGIAWFFVAYLALYLFDGAARPVHQGLIHRRVAGANRATIVSVGSMMAMIADAVGLITFGWLAETTSVATALVVGGAVMAMAAPLYLPAHREQHQTNV